MHGIAYVRRVVSEIQPTTDPSPLQ